MKVIEVVEVEETGTSIGIKTQPSSPIFASEISIPPVSFLSE